MTSFYRFLRKAKFAGLNILGPIFFLLVVCQANGQNTAFDGKKSYCEYIPGFTHNPSCAELPFYNNKTFYVTATNFPAFQFQDYVYNRLGFISTYPYRQLFIRYLFPNDVLNQSPDGPRNFPTASFQTGVIVPTTIQQYWHETGETNAGDFKDYGAFIWNTFTVSMESPTWLGNASILAALCQSDQNSYKLTDYFSTEISGETFSIDGNPVTAVVPASLSVGTHVLTVTKNYDNGVFSSTTPLKVFSAPPVTLGTFPSSVCVNDPIINISAMPIGGTWSGTGMDQKGNFTPSQAGVGMSYLTYSYTNPDPNINPNGCASVQTIAIMVNDVPPVVSVVGNVSGCNGELAMLSVQAANAVNYYWYHLTDQIPFASGQNITYPITKTENLYCIAVNASHCGLTISTTQPILITSLTPAVQTAPSQQTIPYGGLVTFNTSNEYNVQQYTWDFGDGGSSSNKSPAHYYYQTGVFPVSVNLLSPNGCTAVAHLGNIAVGIQDSIALPNGLPRQIVTDNSLYGLKVFPSPFKDHLYITCHLGKAQSIRLQIADLAGNVLKEMNLDGVAGDNRFFINNMQNLIVKNFYLVSILSTEINQTVKVLKL